MKTKDKLIIILGALGFYASLLAIMTAFFIVMLTDDAMAADDGVYLQLHGFSHHLTHRERNYNEDNTGAGLLVIKPDLTTYSFGGYKNSQGNESFYIAAGKRVRLNKYMQFGFEGGLVSGYNRVRVAPFILPVLNIGPASFRIIPIPVPVIGFSAEIPLDN